MTRTICIANQKGGVGKTTTSINLAVGLAKAGMKTLLIDLDPQCNTTTGLGQQPIDFQPLLAEKPLSQLGLISPVENLELLPGCRSFDEIEKLANLDTERDQRLFDHLVTETKIYDFVLIDCPPSIGSLTKNALRCSTEVLIPIQCEYFAMEGLTQMIQTIGDLMQASGGRLEFGGILLTIYDPSLELTSEVDQEVREFFGEIVYQTTIPRDVLYIRGSLVLEKG